MAIVYRSVKGSALTSTEVDNNFQEISDELDTAVHLTGNETIAGVKTFSSTPIIPDEAYGVGWNAVLEPPTKNAVYDKIEALDSLVVHLAGTETITGAKTFSENITMPNTKGVVWTVSSIKETTGELLLASTGAIRVDTSDYVTIGETTAQGVYIGRIGTLTAVSGGLRVDEDTLFEGDTLFNALTASTVPYLDASKNLVSSAVTPAELGYVSGVTSAIQTQINLYKTITDKVTLSSAQILALNSTPIQLVAAPGAGLMIEVLGISGTMNFLTAAYATNTNVSILFNGAGLSLFTFNAILTSTVTRTGRATPVALTGTNALQILANTKLEIQAPVGNPTTGAGSLDIYITYRVVPV
jgi:hypothetical protein